jgi:hypothetical protein
MTVPGETAWLRGYYGFDSSQLTGTDLVSCCESELSFRIVLHDRLWLRVCRVNSTWYR